MLRLHPRQRLVQLEQQLQLRGVDPQIFLDLPRGMPATPALLRLTPVRVVDQHPAHHPRCHRQEVGEVLLFSGRYDEALVATERTLALDPNQVHAYWLRGIAYTQQGRYEEAIVAWRTSIRLLTLDSAHGNLGYVYAVAGRREEALTLLAALKARSGNGSDVERGTTYGIALIHTGLGEREQALEWLERAPRVWLAYVAIDPSLRSLHAEPRFHALLRKVGLAE
jgi:tetratricopeptide (TPR) repeat protein